MKEKKFLIFVCVFYFLFLIFPFAHAASLYFSPSSGNFTAGSNFYTDVLLDAQNTSVNTAEGEIKFDPACLAVKKISIDGSIFTPWPLAPAFSNSQGTISFSGGLGSPGFSGEIGKAFAVNFQALKDCQALVQFASAAVLANDGSGTNVLSSTKTATFSIMPAPQPTVGDSSAGERPPAPLISSETHPDQDRWYNDGRIMVSWPLPPLTIGLSFLLDQNPNTDPIGISREITSFKTYADAGEGIWYFHLKTENIFGWSPVSHFKIQIDLTPPPLLEITSQKTGLIDTQLALRLEAHDSLSGLDYFEVEIAEDETLIIKPEELKSGDFKAPALEPGIYPVKIKAFDKAGNFSEQTLELKFSSPKEYLFNLLNKHRLLLLLCLIAFGSLISLICCSFYSSRKKKTRLLKEVQDARRVLTDSLSSIKSVAIRDNKCQTKKQGQDNAQKLLAGIDETKQNIAKEIDDIEKAIK